MSESAVVRDGGCTAEANVVTVRLLVGGAVAPRILLGRLATGLRSRPNAVGPNAYGQKSSPGSRSLTHSSQQSSSCVVSSMLSQSPQASSL